MEQQTLIGNTICCDGLPDTLSTNYYKNKKPWLVAHNVDEDGTVDFYTMDKQPSKYRCRIPELRGMCIQGFCHGWMILSNDVTWSLWNPVTSKLIRLPPLDGLENTFGSCCLSSPPGDPSSILLLTRSEKPNFVFCRLDHRSIIRKRSRWTEMSYAKQLKRLMGDEDDITLDDLTCCNGKVYALSHGTFFVVLIDIKVVKDKQVVISILPFQKYPEPYFHCQFYVLKGSGTELFIITGRLDAPAGIYLFKLDVTTDDTTWEEIHDLKDAVFFVELGTLQPVSYIPAVASGLGGYVHILDTKITINSFHVKDKTRMLLPMPYLLKVTHQVSMWEYSRGLEADNDREVKCTDDQHKQEEEEEEEEEEDKEVVLTKSSSSSNYTEEEESPLRKLEKYSLVSPWLMEVQDVIEGNMNFTDPVSGDKYSMMLPDAALSLSYDELNPISCSKYGWWLFYTRGCSSSSICQQHQLVFLNPFTNDLRKLPPTPPHYLDKLCFSAPPNCNNCVVVGFTTEGHAAYILRYVEEDQPLLWRRFDIVADYNYGAFCFPTFHGRDLYALYNKGQLVVFKDIMSEEGGFSQPEVVERPPWPLIVDSPQFFLMKRGQYLLLLIWGMFAGDPQLFQFNVSTKKWTQIQSLETDVIFIGAATCLCIEAKTTPKLQNKIYFPRLRHGRLINYSLETSKFYTFDGNLPTGEEALCEYCCVRYRSGLHLSLNAWIEPSWY